MTLIVGLMTVSFKPSFLSLRPFVGMFASWVNGFAD